MTNTVNNLFDVRTFSPDEVKRINDTVEHCVQCLMQISDLKDSMKDMLSSAVESLNDGIEDKELKIKATHIRKLASAIHKDNLDQIKEKTSEIEDGLALLGKL